MQTVKTSSSLKNKKPEREGLPSPLRFKDHFPKVAAAVITLAGCTAPRSGLLTPCPSDTSKHKLLSCTHFNLTPQFEHPEFNHPSRAGEVGQHLSSTWGGKLRTGQHCPTVRLGRGATEAAGEAPALLHSGHVTSPFLALPATNTEQINTFRSQREACNQYPKKGLKLQ